MGLLSVTVVTAGILELPTAEEHDGYQTPFIPILPPQGLAVSSLKNADLSQEALTQLAQSAAYIQPVPSLHSENAELQVDPFISTHLATAQLQVADTAHSAIPFAVSPIPLQHILSQPTVQVQKTILKQVQVLLLQHRNS